MGAIFIRIIIGLMIAVLGLVLAVMVAGAGHGWVAPFGFSLAMLVAWPLVPIRMASDGEGTGLDWVMVIAALLLDLALAWVTWESEPQYFATALRLGLVWWWLPFWGGWQVLALGSLFRRMNLREGELHRNFPRPILTRN